MTVPSNPAYRQCSECGSGSIAIGEARNHRGHQIFPYYCESCGEVFSQYASRRAASAFARERGKPVRRVQTKTERKIEAGRLDPANFRMNQPCEVCGSKGETEEHHWAPRHLFGGECECWPTSLLCRSCHIRWHQTVTPNMGGLPGAPA